MNKEYCFIQGKDSFATVESSGCQEVGLKSSIISQFGSEGLISPEE